MSDVTPMMRDADDQAMADPEVSAMARIVDVLEDPYLDHSMQCRIIRWAADRWHVVSP